MENYSQNPHPDKALDSGFYVDIYNDTALLSIKDKKINELKADENDLVTSSLPDLGTTFSLICGIDLTNTLNENGEYWTKEEVFDYINETRAFLHTELRTVLNLKGIIAEISQALFYAELLPRSTEDLECYAALFRLNLDSIDENSPTYRKDLENLIIEYNYWVLERLRWWQWRDEVLFNRAGSEFQFYPGASMTEFESTEQILLNGHQFYYPRVGSITREFLLDKFLYFDLCHMAGILGLRAPKPFILTTSGNPIIVADTIISMLESFPEIDPRSFITPLGPRKVHNHEITEYSHNFNRHHQQNHSIETMRPKLIRAAYDAGISIYVCHEENDLYDDEVEEKPTFALASEIMAQYMSPQFFTGIEFHRSYLSALIDYKSLDGTPITEFKNYEILFYGIGNGTSFYQFFTWRDLLEIFSRTDDFVDPRSIIKHPSEPDKWSRFSKYSIRRLQRVVIPLLIKKTINKPEINRQIADLNDLITKILEKDLQRDRNYRVLYQEKIVRTLEKEISFNNANSDTFSGKEKTSGELIEFFTNLYNIGIQFSDWEDNFANNPYKKAQYEQDLEISQTGTFNFIAPEYTNDLHDKITTMLTYEIASYVNVSANGKNLKNLIEELRIVRIFGDRVCVAYEDELESISGRIFLMLEALSLGYFDFIETSGNWLMTTSHYYLQELFKGQLNGKIIEIEI